MLDSKIKISACTRRKLSWLPYVGVVGVIFFLLWHIHALQQHHNHEHRHGLHHHAACLEKEPASESHPSP